ncbi:MAG TPA: lamin tail domain-containing protein [Bryobacteraceae bacterium]|jgi:hypothetical protein|nr:lamin tail domain-containing protein [Bryobacteraceae bacterium]
MRVPFCGLLVCLTAAVSAASAASTTLVISQVYGGGGNSGATIKNDFIEILNIGSSAISLNGYSVQYASAAGSFSSSTPLPNVSLQPGHYFLIQEAAGAGGTVSLTPDATGSINMSATAGKVALVSATAAIGSNCSAATVVDLIGYGGSGTPPSCSEGNSPGPLLSNTTAVLRAGSGCTDTDNNGADFSAGTPNPRNSSTTAVSCTAGSSPITITTTSLPTATVNNIYSTTLSTSGGSGARAWTSTALPSGLALSSSTGVLSGTPTATGTTPVTFSVTDNTGTANAQLTVVVNAAPTCNPIPIGTVQGPGDSTPLAGHSVTVSGIVTALRSNGFFIQDSGDGNDATSDGIFVFTSSAPSGNAVSGNAVCVTGAAAEFDGQTELDSPTYFALSGNHPLPTPHVLTSSDLNPAGPIDQLEKYSGMRVAIPEHDRHRTD